METGLTYTQTITVTPQDTAVVHGSGNLQVYATPALVALMENTACKAIEDALGEEEDTVGTAMNVKHVKASGVGERVSCTATLTEIDRRALTFEVKATDSKGDVIGEAIHTRFIINPKRFMEKVNA